MTRPIFWFERLHKKQTVQELRLSQGLLHGGKTESVYTTEQSINSSSSQTPGHEHLSKIKAVSLIKSHDKPEDMCIHQVDDKVPKGIER